MSLGFFKRLLTGRIGLHRKDAKVGNRILIKFFGMQPGERFNRYRLEIEKTQPDTF